ncbi:uncharacterized protein BP01DRAFT_120243 [Aspergillus saccharolyticus JOP 1030-1]|uniref:C2H2-type domain-containing protein n=1 Tax=Aspergillus saccharolyticus JOP 1030-1 TaxID=1450539 RepID=A0A318ZQZ0_9EURO|nr:hypothetical protein BP01DRAFT_120243 [Aspergillus saccharolyticus JOP 1030-1]PYH49065.1 hypothetical protein BP01DRAFT_120243 [Aspergillus saccharolyticus JOP 1030-1]
MQGLKCVWVFVLLIWAWPGFSCVLKWRCSCGNAYGVRSRHGLHQGVCTHYTVHSRVRAWEGMFRMRLILTLILIHKYVCGVGGKVQATN